MVVGQELYSLGKTRASYFIDFVIIGSKERNVGSRWIGFVQISIVRSIVPICSENWNRIKIALILSVLIEIFFFEILIKISFPLIRNANLRRLPLVNKKLRENTGI